MANIIAYIRKEQEKGNVLIDQTGNFFTEKKVETLLKKSYIEGLKTGEIDFSKTFDEYFKEEKESCYTNAEMLLDLIEEELDSPIIETERVIFPEPQETIAQ